MTTDVGNTVNNVTGTDLGNTVSGLGDSLNQTLDGLGAP